VKKQMTQKQPSQEDATTTTEPKPAARAAAARGGRFGRRRGSTAVQAALVLPLVFLFLLGIMEYCRYVMMLQIATNAAREGCRYAVMHTSAVVINGTTYGNATSNVTTIVNNVMGGQSLVGQAVSVYWSDGLGNNLGTWENAAAGDWITVKITGNFTSVIPTFLHLSGSIPITAESVMRSESN
jgi:Flp pilus assembly protein TadG